MINNKILKEITETFSLSEEAAKTALLLLEARARTLDFTFEEYIQRYHPNGIAVKDDNLDEKFEGYVKFLKDDATSVLNAGKSSNFFTFVHECAHVFRRQLTGELLQQAKKAFGVENGVWSEEQEEKFARGLEHWIKRRNAKDQTRTEVYNKGKNFINTVYRSMERIIDIDSQMDIVYEKLFEDRTYIFNQNEYEKTLKNISEGILPENNHIFLGMTPRIYEELGFQRLPMVITNKHLYTTLRENGSLKGFNYHNLGEEILSQIPYQLKKPICIIQSEKDENDIISIISLIDKNNEQIIIPIAQSQKGTVNGAEIEINLVKSLYGTDFQYLLKNAIKDNRLLYIDKKRSEPFLNGQLTHTFQTRSILPPELNPPVVLQDIFGFLPENIMHYKKTVKKNFPERFPLSGISILYKNKDDNQLHLDFPPEIKIPLPNTPDNFNSNFIKISGEFKSDIIEAARFLLREMSKEDREKSLSVMQKAGCSDKESYHKYLLSLFESDNKRYTASECVMMYDYDALENYVNKNMSKFDFRRYLVSKGYNVAEINEIETFSETLKPTNEIQKNNELNNNDHGFVRSQAGIERRLNADPDKILDRWVDQVIEANERYTPQFLPYGSWMGFNGRRLSNKDRELYNNKALEIIEKNGNEILNEKEKTILRYYSGFGGINANERGVLYDYYTSPPVAHLVWKLLEKQCVINGAKALEPSCGTGVFFEYAPKDKSLSFTGVELDSRTAQAAKLLHSGENTEIINQSFEAFNLSDKSGNYDLVIGNAPFGERSVSLSSLDMPDEKSLDNYFISRSIDNLKEGGTMALIVAPGVLENKTNEDFRLSLNKKAGFIGAVRLPDRSFHHTHTQVMPDILLFQKLPDDIRERLSVLNDDEFKSTPVYDEVFVGGKYYDKYPKHIAGELSKGTGQWGNDEIKGDITLENIEKILSSFTSSEHYNSLDKEVLDKLRSDYQPPVISVKNKKLRLTDLELYQLGSMELRYGALKISENQVYILSENYSWNLITEDKIFAEKIIDIKIISAKVGQIRQVMQSENAPELKLDNTSRISLYQEECKKQLSEYKQKFKFIPADDPDIKKFVRDNPAVQGIYEAFLTTDDPLLTQKNVYRKEVEIVDGHNAAVNALLTLREKMKDGAVNNIMSAFPENGYSLLKEMQEHEDIFLTPEGIFQLREDFISGDAWKKIDELRKAAAEQEDEVDQNDPYYVYDKFADTSNFKSEILKSPKALWLRGADELEKAVGWTPLEEADFSPRSSWIPVEIIREWASGKDALDNSQLKNLAKNNEGRWGILHYNGWQEHSDPLIYYLNGQKQRSRYYDTEAYNKEHDDLFRSFISNHETYRIQIEADYNRKFKTHIIAPVKTYPVNIAGWTNAEEGGKDIKPHQWQSVHHLYRRQRGISALGTGFGKTLTSIALMSLLRQEGKAKRIFLQVPNNKVKDWIEEIKDVMPGLKIASIDPEEPGYSNRGKRYAKYQAMAGSDADIIIMPESSASEIQLSPENDAIVTSKISSQYKMEKTEGTARQQETAVLKGERKAQSGKTNVTVCFEDFGCDVLLVDEAHRYKNLFSSSLSRETGLNDGRQSAKAMSLYKKSDYIRSNNNGKNVFLLTATPLTNSPLEYYNMMQFIAPEDLQRMGVNTIDGFIHEFAHIEMGWLYDWGSGQAKEGRILTGFKNLQTLQNLFFTYTDLQNNPDAIGLEKPSAQNRPHVIPADKKQMEVIKEISLELEKYKSLDSSERQERFPNQNFLTFYTRMRTASLDLELYDPETYRNWKNPKLTALARNAFESYSGTKGGQVIFCDRVISSDASFNIHEKIKAELIRAGFKENEIVIVNGFTKSGGSKSDSAIEKEVSKAIADYNAGKYKAIIGTTACIGEGVNLQKNSSSVHHLDIPYRPSDFIQRNGRVDRQGNEQENVVLNTYLAAGTIDNYSVNLVQRKANWIDMLLRTKSDVFTNPNDENNIDADELLLALTEEWGDKEKAHERREEMERQKQEKIKEAQEKQMKAQLKNLSLSRGALLLLEGKENTAEYKKRLTQIENIELSLKANPVFDRPDILTNKEPFIYDSKTGTIFRKGDVFINNCGVYLIENLNFKKQELLCVELPSDERKAERVTKNVVYGYKKNDLKRTYNISDLCDEKKSYGMIRYHIEKASKETAEIARISCSKAFYSLPEEDKEKYYRLHILTSREQNGNFSPFVFSLNDDGSLKIVKNKYRSSSDAEPLNPFSAGGKEIIIKALEKNFDYPAYDKNNMLETLSETLPEFKNLIETAVEKIENETKALKAELFKQSEARMNADTNHIQSRVHVVGLKL